MKAVTIDEGRIAARNKLVDEHVRTENEHNLDALMGTLNDTPLFKTVRFQKHDYSVNEVPQSLRAPRSQRRANRRGTME